mmetsp:Transcript_24024/g.44607  ORF Transcript_24024/g.44607 Transcript_24024/m.44607 type:complete len:252 (-) Transcript_24024:337-1092(-)
MTEVSTTLDLPLPPCLREGLILEPQVASAKRLTMLLIPGVSCNRALISRAFPSQSKKTLPLTAPHRRRLRSRTRRHVLTKAQSKASVVPKATPMSAPAPAPVPALLLPQALQCAAPYSGCVRSARRLMPVSPCALSLDAYAATATRSTRCSHPGQGRRSARRMSGTSAAQRAVPASTSFSSWRKARGFCAAAASTSTSSMTAAAHPSSARNRVARVTALTVPGSATVDTRGAATSSEWCRRRSPQASSQRP